MPTSRDLALLKGFESILAEGKFLDESIGSVLDAALRFFDAVAVALLPAGGAPPISRTGGSIVANAAEQRLGKALETALSEGKEKRLAESGLAFLSAPVRVGEHVAGAFGVSVPQSEGKGVDVEEAVRSYALIFSRLLERERNVATLVKRREEAVALFELATGALHTLNADEVVRLTAASLQRQLEFEQVQAYRYHPDRREVEFVLGHGTSPGSLPGTAAFVPGQRRLIGDDEILVRALEAHGPAFDDADADDSKGPKRRRRLAIPLEQGEVVFGFLVMSRRGAFVLTGQEMRLVQELARLAAGALEKARLIDAERRNAERIGLVNAVHAALAGLTQIDAILERAVEEVGGRLALDLCAVQLRPLDGHAGAAAFRFREAPAGPRRVEVPRAVFERLPAEGASLLLPDLFADPQGLDLVPAPEAVKDLPRPLSLVAVPLVWRGEIVGALLGLGAGRPWAYGPPLLATFQALAVEVSLAITSARLLRSERASFRFLDRLREVGRSFSTTFDAPRIKLTLCEQAVALLGGESAQFWDADAQTKSLRVLAQWGPDPGGDGPRTIPTENAAHPVVRAWQEKALVLVADGEISSLYPSAAGNAVAPRAAAVPLLYQDEQIGVLTFSFRAQGEAWPPELGGRLSLLADAAAVALHNARLMKIIEQQTERDAVTGLYNATAILRRLDSELKRAERSGQPLSVAHIRVDGLSEAAQRFGAAYGDALLPKVAAQLVRATRSVNVVGRGKGDTFWILIFEASKANARRAAEAIQKNFATAFDPRLEATGLRFSLTVGLAAYPEDAFDTASLLSRAEEALDDATKAGAGSVGLYGALAGADLSEPM